MREDAFKMIGVDRLPDDCPDLAAHTKTPEGYIEWHEWAEEKAKTHTQIACRSCGFYSIWVKQEGVTP